MKLVYIYAILHILTASVSLAQWDPFEEIYGNEPNIADSKDQFCDENFVKKPVILEEKETDYYGSPTGKITKVRSERYVLSDSKYLYCMNRTGSQPSSTWRVRKLRWNNSDQARWENFVQTMGRSSCKTVDTCLAGSGSNSLYSEFDAEAMYYSDCADFPLFLRAYFSFKEGLPFRMGLDPAAMPLTPLQKQNLEKEKKLVLAPFANDPIVYAQKLAEFETRLKDVRYTRNGNYFRGSLKVPATNSEDRNFFQAVDFIHNRWSSASFRMLDPKVTFTEIAKEWERYSISIDPEMAPSELQKMDWQNIKDDALARSAKIRNEKFRETDFYSPNLDRKSIRPGTVLYKATGHVAIVYDVTANGDILYMDAHPDNSVTRGRYDIQEYSQANSYFGAGFKNFRPVELSNSRALPLRTDEDDDGVYYYGGALNVADNSEISSVVSNLQYFGNVDPVNTSVSKAKFSYNGRILEFSDFLKLQITNGAYKINPLAEFNNRLNDLCTDIQERSSSITKAVDGNMPNLPHPANLPNNIYGADGDWEAYSTPGRDLRLRRRVNDIINSQRDYVARIANQDSMVSYTGENIKIDLLKAFAEKDAACRVSYKNSVGQTIQMNLSTVLRRLSRISFDPYLCPERRWGATDPIELRTCEESPDKKEWYRLTQFLRNTIDRDPNALMGWNLEELRRMDLNKTVDNSDRSSSYDLKRLLQAL